mmetsp:Transcript_95809/g.151607  ORF Transcript_95809/g.151607 Transcript_95809/m.151607 type:complete len:207 (+) Transcript_95809:260-880(+)
MISGKFVRRPSQTEVVLAKFRIVVEPNPLRRGFSKYAHSTMKRNARTTFAARGCGNCAHSARVAATDRTIPILQTHFPKSAMACHSINCIVRCSGFIGGFRLGGSEYPKKTDMQRSLIVPAMISATTATQSTLTLNGLLKTCPKSSQTGVSKAVMSSLMSASKESMIVEKRSATATKSRCTVHLWNLVGLALLKKRLTLGIARIIQ